MTSDSVQIQDPPLEAIEKKHSCVRRSCVTSCGCFLFVIIGAAALVIWNTKPTIKTFKSPPPVVPADLPLYDPDSIETITYTAGKPRRPIVDGAVIGAKTILAPLVYVRDQYIKKYISSGNSDATVSTSTFRDAVVEYITSPAAPITDVVEIIWHDSSATPNYIMNYYTKELKKYHYTITEKTGSNDDQALFFTRDNIKGVLEIKNDPATPATDLFSITLTFIPS
jgi:hypothetical protein